MSHPILSQYDLWFEEQQEAIQKDFFAFLRFASISTDPQHRSECFRTAEWLRRYLSEMGMEAVLWENPGLPVVFAEHHVGKDRPTVLIYHHYDVQPVDPLDLWQTPPFEPVVRDGKIYARGASDNKGQCFMTITALKSLLQLSKDLQVNIKLFIEGEEESGGEGTHFTIREKKKQLEADYLFAIDFDLPGKGVPALNMGFRGIAAFHVECTNAKVDLHSGSHGGIALNANRILAEMLAKLWDEDGKVAIPHFYDDVRQRKEEELRSMDLSFDEDAYRKEFGVGAFCFQKGVGLREANWLLPTVEINGMWGGYTGSGFKTVIPAKSFAKISCRLVPDQSPQKIEKGVREFFSSHTPYGADVKVDFHHGAEGYAVSFASPIAQLMKRSFEEVFKQDCRYTLCGGSVPIVKDLVSASGAEAVLFGFALATDNIHAPNEHFEWEHFHLGYKTLGRALLSLADMRT